MYQNHALATSLVRHFVVFSNTAFFSHASYDQTRFFNSQTNRKNKLKNAAMNRSFINRQFSVALTAYFAIYNADGVEYDSFPYTTATVTADSAVCCR